MDFQNYFLPNKINIFTASYQGCIKHFKKPFIYLSLYPVYKHFWSEGVLRIKDNNIVYISYEKLDPNPRLDVIDFVKINANSYKKKSKGNNVYEFNCLDYEFSASAFSLLILLLIKKRNRTFNLFELNYNGIKEDFLYGLIETATENNLISTDSISDSKRTNILRIKLKSLDRDIQQCIFSYFLSRTHIIVTGSTGVGKTSQIPKLFWWFNYLFDGYEAFEKTKFIPIFNFDFKKKNTVLSLPRKILIQRIAQTTYESFGYDNIQNTHFNCIFKDSKKGPYYNNSPKTNMLLFIVNQLSLDFIKETNTFIIDEIHEHETMANINISIIYKKFSNEIRNLVLMSATIDEDREDLNNFFGKNIKELHIVDKSDVNKKGQTLFPITSIQKKNIDDNYLSIINDLERLEIFTLNTSIIIFKASIKEIEILEETLSKVLNSKYNIVTASSNTENLQQKIIDSEKNFKKNIFIGTPILESSITIPNAVAVIDNCMFYMKHFNSGYKTLITKNMQIQRKGRVGRTRPGYYFFETDTKNVLKYKRIDHEYLWKYVLYSHHYNIPYSEFFIKPTDMSRFAKTEHYLRYKNINFKSKEIFALSKNNIVTLIEYLNIYSMKINFYLMERFKLYDETQDEKLLTDELKTLILNKTNIKLKLIEPEISVLRNIGITVYDNYDYFQIEKEFEDLKANFLVKKKDGKPIGKKYYLIGLNEIVSVT